MDFQYAEYLLKKTKEDYNRIAQDFSDSRYSAWPEFNIFAKHIKEGEKVLDSGCGNGRLFELFKDKNIEYIGIDNSEKLIEIAKQKHPQAKFLTADALYLPFQDNYFDKVFSVAVLHHIPSKKYRAQFLVEANRVLKPEGFLFLTVWYLWRRPGFWKLITKLTIRKILGRSKLDFKDAFIPWQRALDRYVHCFTKNELKNLVKKSNFKIKAAGIFQRKETKNYNIFLIAQK